MSARDRATLVTARDFVDAGLASDAEALAETLRRYSAAMSAHLVSLVDREDPTDPIALQFTPDPRELIVRPEERADPIGDEAHAPVRGVVHRYRDRVLLKLLTVCPVYCRFCFRRESVGAAKGALLSEAELDAALDYIRAHDEIWEVVLTGGDPFALSPRRLSAAMERLAAIEHVRIVRIHTRAPAAAPDFVTDERIAALRSTRATVYVAIHANHPRELTGAAGEACRRLAEAGFPLLGQTVLLKGVNDDAETLAALMRAFVEARIKPYYLHHPDLAPGTSHFRLPIDEGQRLYDALCAAVSGVARPAYVLDIPGGAGKVSLARARIEKLDESGWRVTDPAGRAHLYTDGRG